MSIFKKLFGSKDKKERPEFCSAVVAAAGSSSRMGGGDKLFAEVRGIPVLARTLLELESSESISEIIVVTREESMDKVKRLCFEYSIDKLSAVIKGGDTRLGSVYKGALAADKSAQFIAIHDGARPFLTQKLIRDTLEAAKKYSAALPALPLTDTIKRVEKDFAVATADRSSMMAAQTPQIFRAEMIKAALCSACEKGESVTDDAAALELLGAACATVPGDRLNIKITTADDLVLAEAIAAYRDGKDELLCE
ncbi:MAG: 2-C-methyl-D-erythritol 4-phosphate cytidylyltransferase [Oscillospiraceae bacterium]|nr:2-C-methyl-D-erythritol 4-phosphate cytidylyltransferase [Oscillospiraceae bacterium]